MSKRLEISRIPDGWPHTFSIKILVAWKVVNISPENFLETPFWILENKMMAAPGSSANAAELNATLDDGPLNLPAPTTGNNAQVPQGPPAAAPAESAADRKRKAEEVAREIDKRAMSAKRKKALENKVQAIKEYYATAASTIAELERIDVNDPSFSQEDPVVYGFTFLVPLTHGPQQKIRQDTETGATVEHVAVPGSR